MNDKELTYDKLDTGSESRLIPNPDIWIRRSEIEALIAQSNQKAVEEFAEILRDKIHLVTWRDIDQTLNTYLESINK